ncbi:nuclear transport factor 2 family protein [Algoriphagus sp. C2-6-M1]|uniref:nuclear transport factor 2 family protein n=1 Tax=Algoriphagus persicinus TaxID=3108754 RepID=UPI002B3C1188|nr:nuclear transport factor 2 family protein [Algoriphagus sp. C2-6-M1]MEB2782946.1 nuclear transport factor 2 family protein [Algoriphagus sp. C2-6-M1]
MAIINVKADCGNSPKMAFLKEFNIAVAEQNIKFLKESVSDTIIWDIVGDKKIEGKENFVQELEKIKKTAELTLLQILSHGKEGATNGLIKIQNGEKYAFSNFYKFIGAKGSLIKSITTYLIKL